MAKLKGKMEAIKTHSQWETAVSKKGVGFYWRWSGKKREIHPGSLGLEGETPWEVSEETVSKKNNSEC